LTKRIEWLDTAKGILIILVVLGHCHVNRITDMAINSFHMATFFSLSGITFNANRTFGEFLRKKVKSLIIPYIAFSVIFLFNQYVKTIAFSDAHFDLFSGLISVAIPVSGRSSTSVYGLWFFPCLFLAEVLLYILLKIRRRTLVGAAILLLIVSTVCVGSYYLLGVASVISILPFAVASLGLGKILAGIGEKVRQHRWLVFVTCLILFIIAVALNSVYSKQSVDLSSMTLGCIPLYVISSILGTVLDYTIAMAPPTSCILRFFGKDSMYYYGLHYEVIGATEKILRGGYFRQ